MVSDSLKCSVALDSTCTALQGVYRNSIHNKCVCLYTRLLSQTSLSFTEFDSVRVPAELSDLSHRLFTNNFFFSCQHSSFNYILVFNTQLPIRLFLHCCNKCYNDYVKGTGCFSQIYERLNGVFFYMCRIMHRSDDRLYIGRF